MADRFCFLFCFVFSTSLNLAGNSVCLTARAALPVPKCAVMSCIRIMAWQPVFGIINMRTDVDVCDCTRELYGHRKSLAGS